MFKMHIYVEKKGKDEVQIFTKIPRGIKLVLKFMYQYIQNFHE